MADPLSIASGVAGLLSLAMEITKLSYGFISDIRSAHSTQRQYLREVSALTDVLLRGEEAAQAYESQAMSHDRPVQLSQGVIDDCTKELDNLRVELEKPTHSIFWPIREKSLRKHIDELARFRAEFSALLTAQTLTTTSATHREVTRLGQRQSKVELLEWVGSSTAASIPVPTPLLGTGVWFLESDCFQAWVQASGAASLWCHGPPGVGKSMLASIVLQYLLDHTDDEDRLVLHFFCDFAVRKTQTKEAIWKSLLGQAIARGGQKVANALSSFRSQRPRTDKASLKDLSDVWHSVLSVQNVLLVIDGPDELDSPVVLKGVLAPFVKTGCRILVTSRNLPEIRAALPVATIKEILSDQEDLKTYVISQFEESGMDDVLNRYPDLLTEVVDKANGIFLLGKILVTQLLELSTAREMRKALQSYPMQLEAAFEKSLERISAQSKSHSTLALRVINWIASTERPLLASELIHGLAVDQETRSIDDEDMVSVKTILKVCGGLVVNPQGGIISLVHTTVHSWLHSRGLARTHEDVAGACLGYIDLSVLPSGPANSAEEADARIRKFPFLSYAAQHWRAHVPNDMCLGPSRTPDKLHAMVEDFFSNASLAPAAFQVAIFRTRTNDLAMASETFNTMPTGQTTLHFAAFWDLPNKVHELLQNGLDVNAPDSQSWTALHWAAFARKEAAIRALLQGGAEVNARDSAGWTPLFWAALHGDASIARVLLENKASHLQQDVDGWTALRWAASRHHVPVMTLLLEHHIKVKDAFRRLPLRCLDASTLQQLSPQFFGLFDDITDMGLDSPSDDKGVENLYKVLASGTLEADDLWTSGHFDPPVGNAWRTYNKVEDNFHRQHPDRPLPTGWSYGEQKSWQAGLLRNAIQNGNLPATQLLLGMEAEAGLHQHLDSSLHAAATRKDPRFVEMLLRFGAEVDSKDENYMTPLQRALADGHEGPARVLVTKGANVNARWDVKQSYEAKMAQKPPLVLALGRRCDSEEKIRLVRLLLEHGADTNMSMLEFSHYWGPVQNPFGMKAIHYAADTRNPELIQLVVQAGGDPKTLDASGLTVIHHFVHGYSATHLDSKKARKTKFHPPASTSAALQLLLRVCGTDYLSCTAKCCTYWKKHHRWRMAKHTPLTLAIAHEDWAMARTLLSLGARFQTNMPLNDALMGAVEALEDDMVELLLHHGAQFDQGDLEQGYWTWESCLKTLETTAPQGLARFKAVIRRICSNGVDINTKTTGGYLFHLLLELGGEEREPVQILLDAGASPYMPNEEGLDAFLVAVLSGKDIILDALLDYARTHPGQSHWTERISRQDGSGSGPSSTTMYRVVEALHATDLINKVYSTGTLLHEAACRGREELSQALLKYHADPTISDHQGRRPIHVASLHGNTAIVDLLMCADSADANILDGNQKSSLHIAAENGHGEIIGRLLSYGAEPNVLDGNHRSPMHFAAKNGHAETIERLLSYGVVPSLADTYGLYPLHFAAWGNHVAAAQVLLRVYPEAALGKTHSVPPDFEFNCPSGMRGEQWTVTSLHVAAMMGNADMVRSIIDAVKQATDEDVSTLVRLRTDDCMKVPTPGAGPTALHMVLATGKFYGEHAEYLSRPRLEIARLLVDHGADVAGVANDLPWNDVQKLIEFPDLWDQLRVGITDEDE